MESGILSGQVLMNGAAAGNAERRFCSGNEGRKCIMMLNSNRTVRQVFAVVLAAAMILALTPLMYGGGKASANTEGSVTIYYSGGSTETLNNAAPYDDEGQASAQPPSGSSDSDMTKYSYDTSTGWGTLILREDINARAISSDQNLKIIQEGDFDPFMYLNGEDGRPTLNCGGKLVLDLCDETSIIGAAGQDAIHAASGITIFGDDEMSLTVTAAGTSEKDVSAVTSADGDVTIDIAYGSIFARADNRAGTSDRGTIEAAGGNVMVRHGTVMAYAVNKTKAAIRAAGTANEDGSVYIAGGTVVAEGVTKTTSENGVTEYRRGNIYSEGIAAEKEISIYGGAVHAEGYMSVETNPETLFNTETVYGKSLRAGKQICIEDNKYSGTESNEFTDNAVVTTIASDSRGEAHVLENTKESTAGKVFTICDIPFTSVSGEYGDFDDYDSYSWKLAAKSDRNQLTLNSFSTNCIGLSGASVFSNTGKPLEIRVEADSRITAEENTFKASILAGIYSTGDVTLEQAGDLTVNTPKLAGNANQSSTAAIMVLGSLTINGTGGTYVENYPDDSIADSAWYGIRAADLTVNAGNVAVLSESDSELETQNICSVRASVVTINGGTLDISAYKDGISTDQINALAAEQLYIKGGTLSSDCSGNYGVEIITSNKYLTPAFEISGGEVTCMSGFTAAVNQAPTYSFYMPVVGYGLSSSSLKYEDSPDASVYTTNRYVRISRRSLYVPASYKSSGSIIGGTMTGDGNHDGILDYTATIKAGEGYDLPDSVTVTVGGKELTSGQFTYDPKTGKITIPAQYSKGDIVVKASCQKTVPDKFMLTASATGNSVKLTWHKIAGTSKYVIYGAKCGYKAGAPTKYNAIKTVKADAAAGTTASALTKQSTADDSSVISATIRGLTTGTSYKYFVAAVDSDGNTLTTSTRDHVVIGSHNGHFNATGIGASEVSLTLKTGGSAKITATVTSKDGPLFYKGHCSLVRYFTSDITVAKVAKNGTVTAVKPGVCVVYAYSPNGLYKAVRVTVE